MANIMGRKICQTSKMQEKRTDARGHHNGIWRPVLLYEGAREPGREGAEARQGEARRGELRLARYSRKRAPA